MGALFSWTSLAVASVALMLILLALRMFGRIRFTFRFRGAVTVSPWAQQPCPHLGLLDEPFIHREEPDDEHRCYLWMQRDRIDLTHQKGFCLSPAHSRCPWLSIAPPVDNAPLLRRLKTGIVNASIYILDEASKTAEALLSWLILKLKGAVPAEKRSADAILPLVAALLALGARQVASLAVVAARVAGDASKSVGRTLYLGLRAATARAARRSGALARQVLSGQSGPAASAAQTVQSEVEVAAGAMPPMAPRQPAPAPDPAISSLHPMSEQGSGADLRAHPSSSFQSAPRQGASRHIESLIEQGKVASMGGNRKLAYSLFSLVVDLDSSNDEAWLWKGATADSSEEKLACLQRALAVNPNNQRAQQAIREMSRGPLDAAAVLRGLDTTAQPGTDLRSAPGASKTLKGASPRVAFGIPATEEALIEAALAALDRRDEDGAYRFFVSATEMNPGSEKAWFWRAKTAVTLDEVIYSLQQALAINPDNEKVRANLMWAIQRQQREEAAEQAGRKASIKEAKVGDQAKPSRSLAAVGFRWLAAMSCLTLAAYWVLVALLPLFDTPTLEEISGDIQRTAAIDLSSVRPLYEAAIRWLPVLTWDSLPGYDRLEITSGYNLLAAVPYTVGFLYLFVAIGVLRRENWSHFWGLAVTILSLAMGVIFSANSQAAVLVTSLGFATVLMLFVSRNEFRRETG